MRPNRRDAGEYQRHRARVNLDTAATLEYKGIHGSEWPARSFLPEKLMQQVTETPVTQTHRSIQSHLRALDAYSPGWLKIAFVFVLAAVSATFVCGQQAPVPDQVHQPPADPAGEARQQLPPFKLPAGLTQELDLTYAKYGTREVKLGLYRPSSGKGPFPGVVFIHGGAWVTGGKAGFSHQAACLATKGYVCVSID
jgi:acetyl esterase/lipase